MTISEENDRYFTPWILSYTSLKQHIKQSCSNWIYLKTDNIEYFNEFMHKHSGNFWNLKHDSVQYNLECLKSGVVDQIHAVTVSQQRLGNKSEDLRDINTEAVSIVCVAYFYSLKAISATIGFKLKHWQEII